MAVFYGFDGRWQLVNRSNHVIRISSTAVYENTQFSGATYNQDRYDGVNRIGLWRATAWVGGWHYLVSRKVRLYYDAYWQPAFNDLCNYRWQTTVGIDVILNNGVGMNIIYNTTHENAIIKGVQQTDEILTIGLSYHAKTKRK